MFVGLLLTQIILTAVSLLSNAQEENDIRLYLSSTNVSAILTLFSRFQSLELGVLQIYWDREWGSVCDDSWDSLDSQVVCSQLNFTYSFSYSSLPYLRGSDQESPTGSPVWLDEVSCIGNETALVNCPSLPFGANDCTHGEDVNMVCSNLNLSLIYNAIVAVLIVLVLVIILCCITCCCCCCCCYYCSVCPLAKHLNTRRTRKMKDLVRNKESHIMEFYPSTEDITYRHDGISVDTINN